MSKYNRHTLLQHLRQRSQIDWWGYHGLAHRARVQANGLMLCSLQNKVFDLCAFKILPETFQMVFSQHLNGSEAASHRMLAYHGSGMILPHPVNLDRHARQVFKSPARSD